MASISAPTRRSSKISRKDRKIFFQEILDIRQNFGHLDKLDNIVDNQAELINKVNQQSELICRNFTRQWNYEMKKLEAECPSTFFLLPGSSKKFNPKNWVSEEYQLFLLCQHPPQPHQAGNGYKLRKAADWWLTGAHGLITRSFSEICRTTSEWG